MMHRHIIDMALHRKLLMLKVHAGEVTEFEHHGKTYHIQVHLSTDVHQVQADPLAG